MSEAPSEQRLATFGRRFAAYLLDGLIGGAIIAAPINYLAIDRSKPEGQQIDIASYEVTMFVLAIAVIIAIGFMEGGRLRATPAKLLLGLRVEDAKEGGPIGFWRAVLRRIVLAPAIWCLGLGVLPITRNPPHPGWHDRAARALVVKHRAG